MWQESIKMTLFVNLLILCVTIRPSATTSTTDLSSTDVGNMSTPAGNMNTMEDSSTSVNSTGTLSTANQTDMVITTSTTFPATTTALGSTAVTPVSTEVTSGSTVVARATTMAGATEPRSTMPTRVTAMTMTSSSGDMTSTSGGGEMTTSGDGMNGNEIHFAVYIAIGVVCGLSLLVVVFAVVLCCRRRSRRNHQNEQPFGEDEMDKLSPRDRMSMHRPVSSTINAEDDLSFVTFNTRKAGNDSQVDGLENPTYANTMINNDEETTVTATGGGDQDGAATMPSTARLSAAGNVEGGVHSDVEKQGEKGKMRPQSGVSYSSTDIDNALDTIDIM